MNITALYCFTLVGISAVQAQITISEAQLIVYALDREQGKYVLCMSLDVPEKGKVSDVIVGDTFTVQPRGPVCYVVMSNAYVLHTKFYGPPSNKIVQSKMWIDVYKDAFPGHTKVIFNNSVVELRKIKIEAPTKERMKTYEGDGALRQMKKMGLKPPDDMDAKKAVGH